MTTETTTETTTTTFDEERAAARVATFDSVAAAIVELDKSAEAVGLVYQANLPGAHSLAGSALMHLLFSVDHARALAFFKARRGES